MSSRLCRVDPVKVACMLQSFPNEYGHEDDAKVVAHILVAMTECNSIDQLGTSSCNEFIHDNVSRVFIDFVKECRDLFDGKKSNYHRSPLFYNMFCMYRGSKFKSAFLYLWDIVFTGIHDDLGWKILNCTDMEHVYDEDVIHALRATIFGYEYLAKLASGYTSFDTVNVDRGVYSMSGCIESNVTSFIRTVDGGDACDTFDLCEEDMNVLSRFANMEEIKHVVADEIKATRGMLPSYLSDRISETAVLIMDVYNNSSKSSDPSMRKLGDIDSLLSRDDVYAIADMFDFESVRNSACVELNRFHEHLNVVSSVSISLKALVILYVYVKHTNASKIR